MASFSYMNRPLSILLMKVVSTKTIALFGGRFDPIHNGHLAVAKEVLRVKKADEVWFSLEYQHQWRPIVASVAERKAMLELAIEEEGKIQKDKGKDSIASFILSKTNVLQNDTSTSLSEKLKIDMTPVELGGLTETIAVMRKIKEKYPQHEFIFVCGSDQLPTFPKWSHWDQLQKEVHFLIVARKGSPLENVPQNATVIDDPTYEPLEDSATRIRDLRKAGKSISGLVPKAVEEYIVSHKLYL